MLTRILKRVAKNLSIEALIRLSARLTADVLFYSMSQFKDPRVVAGVTVVTKVSGVVAKKYKRTDLDPTSIFEDSIDAVTDAF